MKGVQIIEKALERGASLFVRGDRIKVRMDDRSLLAETLEQLKPIKPELLALGQGPVELADCLYCEGRHVVVGGKGRCEVTGVEIRSRVKTGERCPKCKAVVTRTVGLLLDYLECSRSADCHFELIAKDGAGPARCPVCHRLDWWRRADRQGGHETWRCGNCHPPAVDAERYEQREEKMA